MWLLRHIRAAYTEEELQVPTKIYSSTSGQLPPLQVECVAICLLNFESQEKLSKGGRG